MLGRLLVLLALGAAACAENVDAQTEEVVRDSGGKAEAPGRVLTVGDHQVDGVLAAQLGQEPGDRLATGTPDNVTDRQHRDDHNAC